MGRQEVVDAGGKLRPPFNSACQHRGRALSPSSTSRSTRPRPRPSATKGARVAQGLAACCKATLLPGLPSEANMLLVRVPDAAQAFDHPQAPRHPDQEPVGPASAPEPVSAHHGGHAGREPVLLAALAELWAPAPGA